MAEFTLGDVTGRIFTNECQLMKRFCRLSFTAKGKRKTSRAFFSSFLCLLKPPSLGFLVSVRTRDCPRAPGLGSRFRVGDNESQTNQYVVHSVHDCVRGAVRTCTTCLLATCLRVQMEMGFSFCPAGCPYRKHIASNQ